MGKGVIRGGREHILHPDTKISLCYLLMKCHGLHELANLIVLVAEKK